MFEPETKKSNRKLLMLSLGLLVLGITQFGQGGYLYIKAEIAQALIKDAWAQTQSQQQNVKPWGWADTWPVAKISFAGEEKEFYVLHGANGASLAFGPGHLASSAHPGQVGNSVIIGHRDTHFSVLEDLKPQDQIAVETLNQKHWYKVVSTRVARASDISLLEEHNVAVLTLLTCYPFNDLGSDSQYRYIVRAIYQYSTPLINGISGLKT